MPTNATRLDADEYKHIKKLVTTTDMTDKDIALTTGRSQGCVYNIRNSRSYEDYKEKGRIRTSTSRERIAARTAIVPPKRGFLRRFFATK